jgi:hypothetical protein
MNRLIIIIDTKQSLFDSFWTLKISDFSCFVDKYHILVKCLFSINKQTYSMILKVMQTI